MKIAVTITRVLLGLLFMFSAIVVLFNLIPAPPQTGNVKVFNDGLAATGYFMTMLKVIELICGISLVSGYFVPLFTVVLFPISVNIFVFHAAMAPEGMPIAIFVLLANLFIAWYHRSTYAPMLAAR